MNKHNLFSALLFGALIFAFTPAYAYVGPGPGFSFIGSFLTLMGGVVLAVLMVLAYPLRLLIKKMKNRRPKQPDTDKQ